MISFNAYLASQTTLSLNRGDVRSEVKLLRRLSRFMDIYYNCQKVDWNRDDLGLVDKPLQLPPAGTFDINYFRNCDDLAVQCRDYKIVHAYPYNRDLFRSAQALLVSTYSWRDFLMDLVQGSANQRWRGHWYPPRLDALPPVIVAEQSFDNMFLEPVDAPSVDIWDLRLGIGFKGAYVGRLQASSFPFVAFNAYQDVPFLADLAPIWLFGPGIAKDLPLSNGIRYWGQVGKEEVPHVLDSVDFSVYDNDATGNWLGSNKVLESMARGVPVICRDHAARREVLGDEYPLYFRTRAEFISSLMLLYRPGSVAEGVRTYLRNRACLFTEAAVSDRLRLAFEEILGL